MWNPKRELNGSWPLDIRKIACSKIPKSQDEELNQKCLNEEAKVKNNVFEIKNLVSVLYRKLLTLFEVI